MGHAEILRTDFMLRCDRLCVAKRFVGYQERDCAGGTHMLPILGKVSWWTSRAYPGMPDRQHQFHSHYRSPPGNLLPRYWKSSRGHVVL